MKKIILFLVIGIFAITSNVFAAYTLKAKGDVEKTLQQYFQQEQGNRLSIYSMKGLLMEINKAFMENIERPDIKKEQEK